MTPAAVNAKEPESEERPQKSLNEKQQVCVGTLFSLLSHPVIFYLYFSTASLFVCFSFSIPYHNYFHDAGISRLTD